jgi:Family of unknown function (DUF6527)
MGRLSSTLTDTWRRLRLSHPRVDRLASYETLPDVPERLDRHTLAVCGVGETPKWAAFECPCGRGHRIVVSLQKAHRPHWTFSDSGGKPNLHPSVDSHGDFRCHFVLRDGRVTWARETGPARR